MGNYKGKTKKELLQKLDDIIYFLYTHNKNYTKKQYESILDLIDIVDELKERL